MATDTRSALLSRCNPSFRVLLSSSSIEIVKNELRIVCPNKFVFARLRKKQRALINRASALGLSEVSIIFGSKRIEIPVAFFVEDQEFNVDHWLMKKRLEAVMSQVA